MAGAAGSFHVRIREVGPQDFERILAAHEAFVSGRPNVARFIPRMIKVSGHRAERRRLCDIDFTGSVLTGVSFAGSDLSRASFHCADLSRCDFTDAKLARADLRGANFDGAELSGALLDEADMRAAVLMAVNSRNEIRRIGGSTDAAGGPVVHSVNFSNCSMRGVRLRNANMKNANFSNANMAGADLAGAKLEGVMLKGAVLTGIDVARLPLPPKALEGCVTDPLPEALNQAPAVMSMLSKMEQWVRSGGKDGAPATLNGMDLRPTDKAFEGRVLPGLSAKGVVAIDMSFRGAQLPAANFDDADLRGATFIGADLRGASFRGANLAHARFQDADVSDLKLPSGACRASAFDGAVLIGTGLGR